MNSEPVTLARCLQQTIPGLHISHRLRHTHCHPFSSSESHIITPCLLHPCQQSPFIVSEVKQNRSYRLYGRCRLKLQGGELLCYCKGRKQAHAPTCLRLHP